jgi:hypothetical protein
VLGLTIVYAPNFLDRTILNVFDRADQEGVFPQRTAMGLLAGFGFVLF